MLNLYFIILAGVHGENMEGFVSGEDRLLVRPGEFPWDQASRCPPDR